ncbi:MAG: M48 family metallopeptidase [Crocinitomicaceae bacterium]|nr:M48 family metallopeptidase [Crocinitomicaceae bacterium]
MTTEGYFYIIIGILAFDFVLDRVLEYINDKNWSDKIPDIMKDYYDQEKYTKSQKYHQEHGRLDAWSSSISFLLTMIVFVSGLIGQFSDFILSYYSSPFIGSLIFFGVLMIVNDMISLPFSVYSTFVIEEKYGFNKTSPATFVMDKIKGYLVGGIIGAGILWAIIFIFENYADHFWYLAWAVITIFMLFMNMFYVDLILPLFNKLKPLEDGELRQAIEDYSKKVGFSLKNIYIIDGSKRSTKSNAFFSGIGPKKTIVLYDTLIEKHSTEELVAVLAHEVGHYKKKHTLLGLFLGILQTGLTLFILNLFITEPKISYALGAENHTFYLGLVAFSVLYSPISEIMGIISSVISRKNEYEADAFAKETYDGEALGTALKKLSVDNLSNLYPHPVYVFVHYSHPPVLKRLEALDK